MPSETRVQPAGTPASKERENRQVKTPEAVHNQIESCHAILKGLACLAVAHKRENRGPRRRESSQLALRSRKNGKIDKSQKHGTVHKPTGSGNNILESLACLAVAQAARTEVL